MASTLLAAGADGPESVFTVRTVGFGELRILTPTLLELFFVNTQGPAAADRPMGWDWVDEEKGILRTAFPQGTDLTVTVGGKSVSPVALGFRRLPLYAPLPSHSSRQKRDLRIANSLFVALSQSIPEGANVEVEAAENPVWPHDLKFSARADTGRYNPALHVNQTGYEPDWSKKAQVGYYCGTLGEMPIAARQFEIVGRDDGRVVFSGELQRRPDRGFTIAPEPYQQVFEADFSALTSPGQYKLRVAGLGVSYPFPIADGVSGALARALFLGVFHQRDGFNRQELPWTRFVDGPAHTRPAQILTEGAEFARAWSFIASTSTPSKEQSAPQLRDFASQLFPPLATGAIDVTGGHRDAGDYSKYTTNSASALAVLVFAVDSLAGVRDLDNLGIPESGNGIGDLLEEAKCEADFLAKMQDEDGGFWFLVYPKSRSYEDNVLPSGGDAQVVFPKNTSATAAAVGALAQAASSVAMKARFPEAAAFYREKAKAGWTFLTRAIARYGLKESYQKITHYGDEFTHDDELAFAAAGMFAMTGDVQFEAKLKEWCPEPGAQSRRRWTWWHLFEGYGHAFRAYAFALRSGRLEPGQMDAAYLSKVQGEVMAGGEAALEASRASAYGTSYDDAFKRSLKAAYHFSASLAFDLATAAELSHDAKQSTAFRDAVIANVAFTSGSNPENVCFVTGLGQRCVRNVVSQFAQNDERVLPPTGLPVGEISEGPYSFAPYRTPDGKNLLERLMFPRGKNGVPIYDRFIDSFNVWNEATIVEQARSAATALWLFGRSSLHAQKWQAPVARIVVHGESFHSGEPVTCALVAPGVELSSARVVWEGKGEQPAIGPMWTFTPATAGTLWIEAEASFQDGRRVFAATEVKVKEPD